MKIKVKESSLDSMDDKEFADKMQQLKQAFSKPIGKADDLDPEGYLSGDYEAMPYEAFMDDVNALTIMGDRVFRARQKGKDIEVELVWSAPAKAFKDPGFEDYCNQNLTVLWPITAGYADTMPEGTTTMYTEDWSAQESGRTLLVERGSSKMPEDSEGWTKELKSLAATLASDCASLDAFMQQI